MPRRLLRFAANGLCLLSLPAGLGTAGLWVRRHGVFRRSIAVAPGQVFGRARWDRDGVSVWLIGR